MKKQFIVEESDMQKREKFYDYIINTYDFDILYPYTKERFVSSHFPFIVDFKKNQFWVCESVTCCAAAATCKAIITINEFMLTTNNNNVSIQKKCFKR